jgi:Protein of unknown function, DUF547
MRLILVLGLWVMGWAKFGHAQTTPSFDQQHQGFTTVLKTYMVGNLVNYGKLKADVGNGSQPHPFTAYLKVIQGVKKSEFDSWSPLDQMAFLINAYNALTLKLIVDHYPVGSIKDIGGLFAKPWSIKFFDLLGGEIKSLDPIEHENLRPRFKDYRIHAAVNCASFSCPPLRGEAYVGSKLNQQLDEQMRNWISDKTRNSFDAATGEIKVSKIFDWYSKDFESWGGGVSKVLAKFGDDQVRAALAKNKKIEFLDYDWKLNEVKK